MTDMDSILSAWPALEDGSGPVSAASLALEPLSGGLINATYALGRAHILQRLHPIFAPEVNDDIAALTPRLRAAGVPTPLLVPTATGETCLRASDADGLAATWRVLTRLPGRTQHKLTNFHQARAAGEIVAQFHSVFNGFSHRFAFSRPGAHDTDLHLARLGEALSAWPSHRHAPDVAEISLQIEELWSSFGPLGALPQRLVHGDLKVSNLLFEGDAVCGIIDLDTMAWSTLDIELGDALRSWCNPGAEDDASPRFDVDVFTAALQGYLAAAAPWITAQERSALATAPERIALELAARFAADALAEGYFGWDSSRFDSRGTHNLIRARNQLGLALDARRQRAELRRTVKALG